MLTISRRFVVNQAIVLLLYLMSSSIVDRRFWCVFVMNNVGWLFALGRFLLHGVRFQLLKNAINNDNIFANNNRRRESAWRLLMIGIYYWSTPKISQPKWKAQKRQQNNLNKHECHIRIFRGRFHKKTFDKNWFGRRKRPMEPIKRRLFFF